MKIFSAMSGTSSDGLTYTIFEINSSLKFKIIKFNTINFNENFKKSLLELAESSKIEKAKFTRIHWEIGKFLIEAYEDAAIDCDMAVFSGHTIYHNGKSKLTFQIGDVSMLSHKYGIPVISDLRYSDIAMGREGAPLVPFADTIIYGGKKIVINIGGISNITITGKKPFGFDTGPGNMLLDAGARYFFGMDYDRDGEICSRGKVIEELFNILNKDTFIRKEPPKSTGREKYGEKFFKKVLNFAEKSNSKPEDIMATLSYFTAYSIYRNIELFVKDWKNREIICAGGGCSNNDVIKKLTNLTGKKIRRSEEFGIPTESRESLAFGIIAYFSLIKEMGIIDKIPTGEPYGRMTINGLRKILKI